MFTNSFLDNLLIFDLETTSTEEKYTDLSAPMIEEWEKRCTYLRQNKTHPENATMTDHELWQEKAPLQAEFGRVVCISAGKLNLSDPNEPKLQVRSQYGTDEVDILKKFGIGIDKIFVKNVSTKLTGHNIKRFDIPFLSKRFIINGIDLPSCLNSTSKKPWEMNTFDTTEAWSFGSWQEGFASLNLITKVLGLPSPKDVISGADVYNEYWKKNNVEGIKTYCEKDIVATAKVLLRLANFSMSVIESLILL